MSAAGWYGPPNSRRWHYFGADGRSLCGKWLVIAWNEDLVNTAVGPADGDCAACTKKLVRLVSTTTTATAVVSEKNPR